MHLCTKELFISLIEKAKLPKHLVLTTLKQTVKETREQWHASKQNLNLDKKITTAIDQHMGSIPL
jgi:EAL domain-containing protein (putative c-di-GMP-specific phosphodiesterase class I)